MKFLEKSYIQKIILLFKNITKAVVLVQMYELLEVLSIHGYIVRRAPCSCFTAFVSITYLLFIVVVNSGIRSSLLYIPPILLARHLQCR